jgi:hypothetical protein
MVCQGRKSRREGWGVGEREGQGFEEERMSLDQTVGDTDYHFDLIRAIPSGEFGERPCNSIRCGVWGIQQDRFVHEVSASLCISEGAGILPKNAATF